MRVESLTHSVYWQLLLMIPLCAVLQSTLQMQWQIEKQQWIASFTPFVYYIELKPYAWQYEADSILDRIAEIEGLQSVHLDRSVPPWDGAPELSQQWDQLWEKYMPYFIFASTTASLLPINKADQIAATIQTIPGVSSVEWDEERYLKLLRLSSNMQKQGNYLYVFFSAWMLLLSIILFVGLPKVFVRKYAVQHGLFGAGSIIAPEKVLLKIVVIHAIIASLIYCSVQSLMWYCFAFPFSRDMAVTYQKILVEGLIASTFLPAAVLLAGWWFPRKHHTIATEENQW